MIPHFPLKEWASSHSVLTPDDALVSPGTKISRDDAPGTLYARLDMGPIRQLPHAQSTDCILRATTSEARTFAKSKSSSRPPHLSLKITNSKSSSYIANQSPTPDFDTSYTLCTKPDLDGGSSGHSTSSSSDTSRFQDTTGVHLSQLRNKTGLHITGEASQRKFNSFREGKALNISTHSPIDRLQAHHLGHSETNLTSVPVMKKKKKKKEKKAKDGYSSVEDLLLSMDSMDKELRLSNSDKGKRRGHRSTLVSSRSVSDGDESDEMPSTLDQFVDTTFHTDVFVDTPDQKITSLKSGDKTSSSFKEVYSPVLRKSSRCERSRSQRSSSDRSKPVSLTLGWDFKNIKQHKPICKSLESGLQSPRFSTSPKPSVAFFPSKPQLTTLARTQSDTHSMVSEQSPCSPRRFLSYPSMVAEAPLSPQYDSACASPNKFLHRLARRLSFKKKSSKDAKAIPRRESSPLLTSSDDSGKRRSADMLDSTMAARRETTNLTDAERTELAQNETLYRGILRCLLHPLGAPDTKVGFRPGDLVDFVKEIFNIDHDDQEFFIRDELQNKPGRVQASVSIIEARDLQWTADHGGLYCLLTLVQPSRTSHKASPKGSPRASPRNSPRSSPKLKKSPPRSPSLDSWDVLRTQTIKSLREPKWNEMFHLEIDELLTDEIHICICHHDDSASPMETVKHPEKNNAIKSFFRNILQASSDHDKLIPGCVGRIIIPVRDIPSEGCDRWFALTPLSVHTKVKPVGQLRLNIALSCKQCASQGNYFSAEDYHQASLLVHKNAASKLKDTDGLDLTLPAKSRRILNIFAITNGISKLSQNILDLTVLLELALGKYSACVSDNILHRAIEELQMTWGGMHLGGTDYMQQMPLCDVELCLYRTATRHYVEAITETLQQQPSLFPPCVDGIHIIKTRFSIAQHLLELDLWEAAGSPQRELANALVSKLQADVRLWVETNLGTIHAHSQVKDAVIPEIKALVEVTNSLISICTPLGIVEQFFSGLGVKYYRIVSFETERKLSSKVRELMMGLDKYQVRYHNFPENLHESCTLSIKLFLAVRSFYQTVRENLTERDFYRMSIPNYQDWFQETLVFWLHMFRTECTSRIQKALEIDKDFVLVTSLVKYSNSSVDAQTCFSEITREWTLIDIQDADSAIMGVTKITDMICDGARVYASRIQNIFERNCYYDSNEGQFDVTDRMCITLNNIEHVRMFLSQLPDRLNWDDVTTALSQKHENHKIGQRALSTLHRLIRNAHEDILLVSARILRCVCAKMSVEIARGMELFLIKSPEKNSATDKLTGYLSTNLEVLSKRLSETIYPHMISELWILVVNLFSHDMLVGKPPDYYEHLQKHMRALTLYFQASCTQDFTACFDSPCVLELRNRIEMNSLKTEKLMLEYYQGLAQQMSTPLEYLGHLALKLAYMEETRGNITIYVKVIQGFDLPGLDSSGLSDPYVVVSLQPEVMLQHKPQKTRTIDQTLQPVFNSTFQFPNVPKEFLSERGMVLLLSVMDRDIVKADDFAGEVVISLDSIPTIGVNESVDSSAVVMMPLKRPFLDTSGPYQILEERSSWDKSAKAFVRERRRFIDNQAHPTDTVKDKLRSFFKLMSKGKVEDWT